MNLPLLLLLLAPTDMSVVGVVVAKDPASSVAVLRSGGQSRIVRSGDTAFGAKVVQVARDGVTVAFGDERKELRLRAVEKKVAASAPIVTAAGAGPPAAKTMGREEVQRRLAEETPRILSETAIAPVVAESGNVRGFSINRMPAGGSLLSDAGLRVGDVITEINGTPIDSLPTLIGLWPRLQNEKQLTATVLRNGTPVTLSVNLR